MAIATNKPSKPVAPSLFGDLFAGQTEVVAPATGPIAPQQPASTPAPEPVAVRPEPAPVASPARMTLKDWAARNGISHAAALNHISRKVIAYVDYPNRLVDVQQCDALLMAARVNVARPRELAAAGRDIAPPPATGPEPGQRSDTPPGDSSSTSATLVQQNIDLTAAKIRKAQADASAAELRTAQARGELVPRDAVVRRVEAMAMSIRAPLQSMAARLGPVLASMSDPVECSRLVRDEVERALTSCADGLPDWDGTDEG